MDFLSFLGTPVRVVLEPASKGWLEYLLAFGPLIIGAAVAYIAFEQHRTNKRRLKLELFDRRYDVFETFRNSIEKALSGQTTENELIDLWLSFNRCRGSVAFLFESNHMALFDTVLEYLREVRIARSNMVMVDQNSPQYLEDSKRLLSAHEALQTILKTLPEYFSDEMRILPRA